MKILLTGATGFIGHTLHTALLAQGHTVIRAVRIPSKPTDIAVNFLTDIRTSNWLDRMQGVDAVVNAVGILGGSADTLQAVHADTPAAMAAAATQQGVKQFIQVSALGVDSGVNTAYFNSKLLGEHGVRQAFTQAHIVRPSLVFGHQGQGSKLFMQLTRVPVLLLPKAGRVTMQPVHVLDVAAGVVALLQHHTAMTVAAVGPEAMSLADYLKSLTQQLGRHAPFKLQAILAMPLPLARLSARCASLLPQYVWTPDTLTMLLANNQADAAPFTQLLGYTPKAVSTFVATQ